MRVFGREGEERKGASKCAITFIHIILLPGVALLRIHFGMGFREYR